VIGRHRRRREAASVTYKLCSLLLSYPDEDLLDSRDALVAIVNELPRSAATDALARFCAWWGVDDPLALQEHYVETFDLDKRSGLYLSYYSEGDTRGRGMALLRLKRLYRAAGLPLDGSDELPDYLPVMLEFAAAAPDAKGELVLREHRAALELLRLGLHERGTHYADVLDAVCLTIGEAPAAVRARAAKLAAAGPPLEEVGLEPFVPPEVTTTGARR
jgi:nitrate reductase delta subunit